VEAARNISAVVALEIPLLVPKENKLSLVDSLGIIKNVVEDKLGFFYFITPPSKLSV
jgi:hypothetical protein